MASSLVDNLLGIFTEAAIGRVRTNPVVHLSNLDKILLAVAGVAAYVVFLAVFGLLGLPALPKISSLLLQGQPIYAIVVVWIGIVAMALLMRPLVGRVRFEAPVFCAAVGLLALPTHGGDFRHALIEAAGPAVYLRMAVELLLLATAVAAAYLTLGVGRSNQPTLNPDDPANLPAVEVESQDTAVDRLAAVGIQTIVVIALLSFLGKSPLKGQALCGLALASGLAAWVTYKTRQVDGSVWSVAGTLLAGLIAYGYSFVQPDGLAIADVKHALAGAAYSLPLHYASAGVAGAIYGYWTARAQT